MKHLYSVKARQFLCIDCPVSALIQCQAVVALVGQTVFHGRIYKSVDGVDFRLEFLVSGSDITLVSATCIQVTCFCL